jgi:hypothetical protein
MGTNSVPLLADLFLYSYEVEFIQKFLHERNKPLAVAFNSTFRYIDVLSINNDQFHSYVSMSYIPVNLKLKTPQNHLLQLHTNIDAGRKLTIQVYDKRDDFSYVATSHYHLHTGYTSLN